MPKVQSPKSDLSTEALAKVEVLHRIVASLGMPLFLFSASLMTLLIFSWLFVLPHFTQFGVGDKELPASAIAGYKEELTREVRAAEERRDAFLLPARNKDYAALKQLRGGRPDFFEVRADLLSIAALLGAKPDVITLSLIDMDEKTGIVRLTGDVRNVGPRSMTVLAQFVEALRDAPFVTNLTPPAYVREGESKEKFYSPFSLEFSLSIPSAES